MTDETPGSEIWTVRKLAQEVASTIAEEQTEDEMVLLELVIGQIIRNLPAEPNWDAVWPFARVIFAKLAANGIHSVEDLAKHEAGEVEKMLECGTEKENEN